MAPQDALGRVAEIPQQVEPIGDLERVGCSLPRAVRIDTTAIPANNLGPWVLPEPGTKCGRGRLREELGRPLMLQVDGSCHSADRAERPIHRHRARGAAWTAGPAT